MNKKLLSAVSAALLAGTLLVGCGSSKTEGPQDGTYKAEFSEADSHGWTGFVELTIEEGKIVDCKADYKNEEDKLKSEDEDYKAQMEPVAKTYPKEFSEKFSKQLIEKGNIEEVDSITGATTSSSDFKLLATEALKAAEKGNTDVVKVKPAK
ncbi:FMN-binding protein [Clostridium ihumii]|uniref:FMN-binding protein n=1 Tax=Clostridium ihumii TaxID=1470356 RepID=UPI00058FC541|nr:FMN-binding protein [Clostridium ihumii]